MNDYKNSLRSKLVSLWSYLRSRRFLSGIILSIIVGLGGGFGAIVFRWLINSFHRIFFGGMGDVLGFLGQYYVILVPAAGGLIVGCIIYFTRTGETKGHGVPEVMEAVWGKGGRIRARVAAIKAFTQV